MVTNEDRMLAIESRIGVMTRLGRALSDPTRSRILLLLLQGPNYPAAISQELSLSRSNVSNHLACLRDCGIIVAEMQGRRVQYEIVDAHLTHALNDLMETTLAVDRNSPCSAPQANDDAAKEPLTDLPEPKLPDLTASPTNSANSSEDLGDRR